MTVFNQFASGSGDDGQEDHAGVTFTTNNFNLNTQSHGTATLRRHAGFFYNNVTIPAGSTIDSATFEISPQSTGGAVVDVRAHDVDNAQDFAALADVTTRTSGATSAGTAFTIPSGGRPSVSITAVIQEIIDRAGWASGNNIVILFVARNTPNAGSTYIGAGHVTEASKPELTVTFTEPAAGGAGGPGVQTTIISRMMRRGG